MRAKDLVLIVGAVGGLVAGLGKIFVLANAVDVHDKKIEILEPAVAKHETKIEIIDERWDQIQKQIETINRKLDRGYNGR